MKKINVDDVKTIKSIKFDDEICGNYIKAQYICGDTEDGMYYPTFLISVKLNDNWVCRGDTITGLSKLKKFINAYDLKQLRDDIKS